jgi:Ca2+/H+ antiporter
MTNGILKPSINWLFIFIPITLALEHAGTFSPPMIFFSAALAIVPIAALIVHATEQIATRTGDAIGGLLNATFGNAPELICWRWGSHFCSGGYASGTRNSTRLPRGPIAR